MTFGSETQKQWVATRLVADKMVIQSITADKITSGSFTLTGELIITEDTLPRGHNKPKPPFGPHFPRYWEL